ncbi:MAG: hypothetical protein H6892_03460 [Brucellaceae bacterium]|nr:hypothetical protein [Brucellaceae bacterium]
MLVRRFTIVCLLIALFGIGFAGLAVEASRPAQSWTVGTVVPCIFENGVRCSPSIRP